MIRETEVHAANSLASRSAGAFRKPVWIDSVADFSSALNSFWCCSKIRIRIADSLAVGSRFRAWLNPYLSRLGLSLAVELSFGAQLGGLLGGVYSIDFNVVSY